MQGHLPNLRPGTTYQFRIGAYDQESGSTVDVYSPEPYPEFTTLGTSTPPSATLDPVTDITGTSAHFSGAVDTHAPAGPLPDEAKAAYKTDWHFECTPACPGDLSGTVEAEEGSQDIDIDVGHLDTNTHYQVKLVAHNTLETVESEQPFDTPLVAPTVKSLPGGSDGEGGYILAGVVNPNHSEITSCEFKWGPNSASYAFSAPCSPAAVGNGGQPVTVEAHLTKLNPDVVYHADLIIKSAFGEDDSGDFEFTPTLASHETCPNEQLRKENDSLELPECRAYERVTDGSRDHREGRAAYFLDFSGGEAVEYDSKAPNIANSGQADVFHNYYVATRTPLGWQTIPNLNGPTGSMQSAPEFANTQTGNEYHLSSADLLSSIYALNKQGVNGQNAFLRQPDGRFELVGLGCVSLTSVLGNCTILDKDGIQASDDLSHVIFSSGETDYPTTWGRGVYEFLGTGNTDPRRVDVDNSDDPVRECKSNKTQAVGNFVSNDGSVIVFTVAGTNSSCANSGPGLLNAPQGDIWARVSGATSYDVSASRCERPDCNAPAISTFQGAAKDGSRIFFTTTEQLLDGDTDQTSDLYACDIPSGTPAPTGTANSCSSLSEVSGAATGANVQAGAPGGTNPGGEEGRFTSGDVTVSDDGSSAYFTAKGVLADNEDALGEEALPGDRNLYVWRTDAAHPDGQTTFVARLTDGAQLQTTPDGRYLALQTTDQLVLTDTDSSADIYRYDAVTGEMARVSTGVSGAGGNGEFDARFGLRFTRRNTDTPHHSHFSISDNGELIVFLTSEPLSPSTATAVLTPTSGMPATSSDRWARPATPTSTPPAKTSTSRPAMSTTSASTAAFPSPRTAARGKPASRRHRARRQPQPRPPASPQPTPATSCPSTAARARSPRASAASRSPKNTPAKNTTPKSTSEPTPTAGVASDLPVKAHLSQVQRDQGDRHRDPAQPLHFPDCKFPRFRERRHAPCHGHPQRRRLGGRRAGVVLHRHPRPSRPLRHRILQLPHHRRRRSQRHRRRWPPVPEPDRVRILQSSDRFDCRLPERGTQRRRRHARARLHRQPRRRPPLRVGRRRGNRS